VGLVVLFRHVPAGDRDETDGRKAAAAGRLVYSLWPILLAIVLIFGLKFSMLLSLGIAALSTQLFSRFPLKERGTLILKSLDWKAAVLIVSVMVFKQMLEASGALSAVTKAIPPHGPWAYVMLFAAPFLMGFLTGVNQAFVGISFPMLLPIFGEGHPDIVLIVFAYVSGFIGILLSPTHLCLVTTLEYFQAELKDVYRIMIVPAAVVFAGAFLALLVFRIL
jgi:hypothetical protein